MPKIFEYRIFAFDPMKNKDFENFLNELGFGGWEVIQVNDDSLVAKREKETPNYLNK